LVGRPPRRTQRGGNPTRRSASSGTPAGLEQGPADNFGASRCVFGVTPASMSCHRLCAFKPRVRKNMAAEAAATAKLMLRRRPCQVNLQVGDSASWPVDAVVHHLLRLAVERGSAAAWLRPHALNGIGSDGTAHRPPGTVRRGHRRRKAVFSWTTSIFTGDLLWQTVVWRRRPVSRDHGPPWARRQRGTRAGGRWEGASNVGNLPAAEKHGVTRASWSPYFKVFKNVGLSPTIGGRLAGLGRSPRSIYRHGNE